MEPGALIKSDTVSLSLSGGRRVGQPGHDVAREYVLGRMNDMGLRPFSGDSLALPYRRHGPSTGRALDFVNLAGIIPGNNRDLPPVLVGAHYDSAIDAPCSDDNAAAVAVTLAFAEAVRLHPLQRDAVLVLFDAEEPPFFQSDAMGSIRFCADHCRDVELAAGIVMDLIGHDVESGVSGLNAVFPHLKDLIFVMGSESHPSLPGVVEQASEQVKGLRVIPALNDYVGDLSDHGAFRLAGHPYLFISCGRGRHYHDPLDAPDQVNFSKVRAVYRFVLALARGIDANEVQEPAAEVDTTEFEISMIRKAVGRAFPHLTKALGLERLQDRSGLDRWADALKDSLIV